MQTTLQAYAQERGQHPPLPSSRAVGWGILGGGVGTLAMDLLLMGGLSAVGMPTFTCFSIVGGTAASLFARLGIEIAGGIPAGVAAHYLVGPLFGLIFGVIVTKVAALRARTLKRSLILAVLYVEVLSQPILAMTPMLLKMTLIEIIEWFGISFVMHFIFAIVLGFVVSYGLRLPEQNLVSSPS